jgi:transposase
VIAQTNEPLYRAYLLKEHLRLVFQLPVAESMNTKIRLIIRRGFGFHDAKAIIALAMLSLGAFCPPLPGRA